MEGGQSGRCFPARFFIPSEEKSLDLFEQGAQNIVEASHLLADLVQRYESAKEKVDKTNDMEHRGDNITRQVMEHLYRSFVTPLDQEDIALVAHRIDDVTDFIEGASVTQVPVSVGIPVSMTHVISSAIMGVGATRRLAAVRRGVVREIVTA